MVTAVPEGLFALATTLTASARSSHRSLRNCVSASSSEPTIGAGLCRPSITRLRGMERGDILETYLRNIGGDDIQAAATQQFGQRGNGRRDGFDTHHAVDGAPERRDFIILKVNQLDDCGRELHAYVRRVRATSEVNRPQYWRVELPSIVGRLTSA